jgi:probable O-glycosylation ligase (exosortase A-associated)
MLIPLMYYLADSARRPLVRYGLRASMVACGFAILGTHSRGALLAACAAALFLGIKSRRPVMMTIVFVFALAGAAAFMPDSWTSRMNTIETFDQDASAMSRLDTWATIWRLALSRPIVGAGFNLDNPAIFMQYGALPNQEVYTAHSIYFQALGEHGFPGLALLLLLGVLVWSRSRKVVSIASGRPELDWAVRLARMIQVSVLVFAVGGAFLGLLHFDLPYYLAALIVLLEVEVRRHTAEQDKPQPESIVHSREMSSV